MILFVRLLADHDHLLFSCALYCQLWLLTLTGWLGISATIQGFLIEHFLQFGGLGSCSNKSRLPFNIIWISALITIWKDRDMRHFHNKSKQLLSLLENV